MSKIKKLFAIHTDAFGKTYRTKIAEGTTADFAYPIGMQVEDFDEEISENEGHSQSLGLNGSYPIVHTDQLSHLEGKLLTLCDATFTNKDQREAFKSVIREILWGQYSSIISTVEGNYSFSNKNVLNKYIN